MNKEPFVSVVMSAYNAELYIEEAIQSILNQTFKNFEFIIIDDGSTDKSLDIIHSFQKSDRRIIVISRENRGLIESLNEGIRESRGKYIARMDADDIAMPIRIEEQILHMEGNENIVVCGSFVELFGAKKEIRKYPVTDEEIRDFFVFRSPFAHPATMIYAKAIKKKMYNKKYIHAEDYKLWMELMSEGEMYNIPKVLLRYRITPDQITSVYGKDSLKVSRKIRREYIDKIFLRMNINMTVPDKISLKDIKKLKIESLGSSNTLNTIRQVYYLSLEKYSWMTLLSFLMSKDYLHFPYGAKDVLRVIYFHIRKDSEKWL
jgi:glycosyltransferase involved in cell wall biosynthesis